MPKKLSLWESWEAMEETIRRDTQAVSVALHQSASLTSKWKLELAADDNLATGARNPLDRLVILMETIERIDGHTRRAHIAIRWLCARFGYLPPVKMPAATESPRDLLKSVLAWHEDVGETCRKINDALKDGRITRPEARAVLAELLEDFEKGFQVFLQMKAICER